jgi:predicted RNA-binding protein (virulence factor B family)
LLEKPGYEKIDPISQKLLETLQKNNGFLALNDKTSPEIIQALLGISKKNFKKGGWQPLQIVVLALLKT